MNPPRPVRRSTPLWAQAVQPNDFCYARVPSFVLTCTEGGPRRTFVGGEEAPGPPSCMRHTIPGCSMHVSGARAGSPRAPETCMWRDGRHRAFCTIPARLYPNTVGGPAQGLGPYPGWDQTHGHGPYRWSGPARGLGPYQAMLRVTWARWRTDMWRTDVRGGPGFGQDSAPVQTLHAPRALTMCSGVH
jgi:hypothetical protein